MYILLPYGLWAGYDDTQTNYRQLTTIKADHRWAGS